MTLGIFVATYNAESREEPYAEALDCYRDLADEVYEVKTQWPHEFKWDFIGQRFQEGYEKCKTDWCMRVDLDYLIHENDFQRLRNILDVYPDEPALSMYKHQFILVDRYNLKSRVVNIVNKKKYGDRIRFDSGGDLCQPSLDGKLIELHEILETKVPIWNYDFSFKTKENVFQDFGRFARAWYSHFGEYKFGGPSDKDAFRFFLDMQIGRAKRSSEIIPMDNHPIYIRQKLQQLDPEQLGYSLWGLIGKKASYYA